MNNGNIDIEEDDIVHWWGDSLPNVQREIVVSNYGPYYLDMGVGNFLGYSYGSYAMWNELYNLNLQSTIANYANKNKVLGG